MELVRTGTRRAIALPPGETGTVHVVDHDDMVSVDLGYDFDEFIIRILDIRPCQRIMKEIFDEMMLNLGLNIWIRTSKGRVLTTS
jgi:hypothetical protein